MKCMTLPEELHLLTNLQHQNRISGFALDDEVESANSDLHVCAISQIFHPFVMSPVLLSAPQVLISTDQCRAVLSRMSTIRMDQH